MRLANILAAKAVSDTVRHRAELQRLLPSAWAVHLVQDLAWTSGHGQDDPGAERHVYWVGDEVQRAETHASSATHVPESKLARRVCLHGY